MFTEFYYEFLLKIDQLISVFMSPIWMWEKPNIRIGCFNMIFNRHFDAGRCLYVTWIGPAIR